MNALLKLDQINAYYGAAHILHDLSLAGSCRPGKRPSQPTRGTSRASGQGFYKLAPIRSQ